MSVYLVALINIHDRAEYANYAAGFIEVFNQYDGKLLAVDESPDLLEGEWPYTRTVLIEFPSAAQADAWYHSQAYQQLATHRFAASVANLVRIKGV
jgi:uncharacterized protein (DUF1330 family)